MQVKIIIVMVLMAWAAICYGQPVLPPPEISDPTDFRVVQKEMNQYFSANPEAKGYKQWKRKEWFLEPRLYPSGEMENLTLKTWKAYDRYMKTHDAERATHGEWTFLGPSSCNLGIGRLNCIAFHPTNANIIYVGSANGGVWKSTNGGTSWSNISPNIPLLAISDIKLSPSDPNDVYILTGDGDPDPHEDNAHGQTEVSSIGILRSGDAGGTWYPTNFSFDHPSILVGTKLLIHPSNVNIQYVASESGLYRTEDHWATWVIEENDIIYDIEFQPGNPDIMYASGVNDIYRSTNGGETWLEVFDSDFSNMSGAGRVELAVAPNNSDVVYALSGSWNGGLEAFFESQDEGTSDSWTVQNTSNTAMGQYADYCMALTVSPTDWKDVFGGMQWICKSTNQGVNWSQVVQSVVHADIHDVAYAHGALWVCCDGGLYKSVNEGSSWTDLSAGLGITEVYRITGTPQVLALHYQGCQDNGTMRRNSGNSIFERVTGGDGMTCMINYENSDIVYTSSQDGDFYKSESGGDPGTFFDLTTPGGSGDWISPAIMDPINPDRIFIGKTDVYRSDNEGGSWFDLNAPSGMGLANCLAQGTSNRNRLYVSSEGAIYRSDNALAASGTTWDNIGGGLPDRFITGIAVDPANSLRVFVTLSGYVDGDKVFRSEDGGVDWDNISGSLPNVPANCIRFHDNGQDNDALYIGTDIGVFYRDNDVGDWVYYSNLMPVVNVNDLYINTGNNTISAGTYGRGLWRSTLYSTCHASLVLTSGTPGVHYSSASISIASIGVYRKDLGTETHYQAGDYILLSTNFEAGGHGYFHGTIGPCPETTMETMQQPFQQNSRLVMDGFQLLNPD